MSQTATLEKAIEWHRQGRVKEACAVYERVLREEPQHAAALQWLATAQAQGGDLVAAMDLYGRALKIHPNYAEAHANRGNVLRYLSRYTEALESFDRAIQLRPDYAEADNNRGITLRDMQRLEEALLSHDRALEIRPDYGHAWKCRGLVLGDLKRFTEALTCHDRAIELCAEDAQAFKYRGNVLYRLKRFEEAVQSYTQAITLRPGDAEAFYNRGLPLRELLRLEEAIESCERAIQIRPDYAEPWWNQAEMRILAGDYEQGWPMLAWRWRSREYGKVMRALDRPLWDGVENLRGKTLLITLDGGFGDTLNFCRYAPGLAALGIQVIMEVQCGLLELLRGSFPTLQVIANGEDLPAFDWHCPMMNLPGLSNPSLNGIPAEIPYLQTSADKVREWQGKLEPKVRPRIGLVWSGSLDHSNDPQRSMPVERMFELMSLDAEFHCLQKHIRDSDREALRQMPIRTWEADVDAFAETAALVMAMDLVISVDTSVAHLAGGLGKPVWVLLPYVPDMRWLLGRQDSPWYPSVMRLFRQTESRTWPKVILRAKSELARFLQTTGIEREIQPAL